MKFKLLTLLILSSGLAQAGSPYVPLDYDAEFNNTIGFTYSDASPPSAAFANIEGPNWRVFHGTQPSTGPTPSNFGTDGDSLVAQNWGNTVAKFETAGIDVSTTDAISIVGIASTVGSLVFGDISEYFRWFYEFDGNSGLGRVYGSTFDSDGSLNTDSSWTNIDASEASGIYVGFEFLIDGVGEGFDVSSVSVSAVPEPGVYALLAGMCSLGFVMLNRRSA